MANRAKKFDLGNKTSRLKLKPRAKPYFVSVEAKLTLGYVCRRPEAGQWVARRETGRTLSESGIAYPTYTQTRLGLADDIAPADGAGVLNFEQAKQKAAGQIHTGPITVAQAVGRYIEHLRAAKGDTAARDAEQRLALHVVPTMGQRRVVDLALSEMQKWKNDLVTRKAKPVSRSTANRIMANLKAALNLAFQDDKNGIPTDKAWRALDSFESADTAREEHFEADDVQKLIDAARKFDPPFAELLTGGFLTGGRYGELTACDVRHFDPRSGVLAIPSGKTGARPVTLLPDAVEFFKRLTKGRDRNAPLFETAEGNRWGKSEQHRRIKRALKDAKLPEAATFYSLRHSHISRAIEEDVPLFILARNCGTSETMIRKHYAKLLAKKERKMLERAAGAFKLRVIKGGKNAAA
jgi:integrase